MRYIHLNIARVQGTYATRLLILIVYSFLLLFSGGMSAQQTFTTDEIQLRRLMEQDGASLPDINRVIEHRRLQEKLKSASANNRLNAGGQQTNTTASCADMGGETGWGDWEGAEGTCGWGATVYPAATNPPPSPFFTLTSGSGIEQCSVSGTNPNIPFVAPGFGSHSLRLGEPQVAGFGAEKATFSFFVNPSDTDFTYMYAIVIQDAGHSVYEQPYVSLCIHDATGASLPCGCFRYTGGPSMPGFTHSPCGYDTYYKPWTVVGVDLTPYVGQVLTVEIENVDCKQGGHYAYSYWDFTCGSLLNDAGYYCTGQSSDMCVPPDPSGQYTYLWHQNGLPYTGLPNATSACIQPVPHLGDTFTVTIHPPSGCDFDLAYIPHPFEIYPNFIDFTNCGDVEFMDISTTSVPGIVVNSWQWDFPTGNPQSISTQYPGTVNFAAGDHTVSLIVSANNCYDTIQHTFTLDNLPEAQFSASTACFGSPVEFSDQSWAPLTDSIRSWTWLFPNGSPTASFYKNPSTNFNSPGDQSATLIVQTIDGCIDTIEGTVTVHELPAVNFESPQTGCAPFSMTVENTTAALSDSITDWQWSFPGGVPSTSTLRNPPAITYEKPGVYYAYLYAQTQYGCSSRALIDSFVTVHSLPTADFTTSQTEATGSNPEFEFKQKWSYDVAKWMWNFGDGTTDIRSTDPTHNYSVAASDNDFYTFPVSLVVENIFGCRDTHVAKLRVLPETAFFIPNTFTPNSDDVNDLFFGKSYGVKEYHIAIYDRWGVLVWECEQAGSNTPYDKNSNEGMASLCKWDGKISGSQSAQNDVFVYKVRLLDVYDREYSYVGRVNLLH